MLKLKSLLTEDDTTFIQIADLPLTAFVSKFETIASDPKVQSVIRAGVTDGRPTDEQIRFSSKKIFASDLIPTQNQIGQNESLVNILNDKYNSLDSFLNGEAKFNSPIVTLNGKYIIDGHHRWSQAYLANPKVKVPVYDMTSTITPQQALKATHIAIAADLGKLPLSPAKGINLYAARELDIQRAVKVNLTEQARKLYEEHGHGKTTEEISAYIWKNVQLMQTKNKPISGAPPRTSMPQTGDSQDYDTLLTKGIINFKNPKKDDVKTESRIKLKGLIR